MSDTPNGREERVAELRRQWLAYAGAAFGLMFHPEHQADLASFDQRETRACESVDDLKAWLLQQHLASDPDACPPPDRVVNCPAAASPPGASSAPTSPSSDAP